MSKGLAVLNENDSCSLCADSRNSEAAKDVYSCG